MFVLCVLSLSVMSDSLRDLANSSGKNTGMRSHSLLQGIFLTQELNIGLMHCRQILYQLNYKRTDGLVCIFPSSEPGTTSVLVLEREQSLRLGRILSPESS